MYNSKYDRIRNRVIDEAQFIIATSSTVRQTAKSFKVGKSTVYKDVAERLWYIDVKLAREVCEILLKHKDERHKLGGEATRQKYLKLKEK